MVVLLPLLAPLAASAQQPQRQVNPAVQAIREINPTTSSELIWAIRALMNMSEYGEANRYVTRLLALELDEAGLLELHDEYGSGIFFRMGRDAELSEEGQDFGFLVLDAANRAASDPQRLRRLVSNLDNPDPAVRYHSVVDLKYAGVDSVGPLLEALDNPQLDRLHDAVRGTLIELGEASIEPLIAALQSPSEEVLATAMEVLGELEARRALPYLVRPLVDPNSSPRLRQAAERAFTQIAQAAPSPAESEIFLRDRARAHYGDVTPLVADEDGLYEIWRWSGEDRLPFPLRLELRDASLVVAADLAADLHTLWPENDDYRRLFLSTHLESEKVIGGYGAPLATGPGTFHDLAASAGTDAIEEVLIEAVHHDRPAAAMGAIEVLGNIGTADLLTSTNGQPRPLVAALRHPDRRVRFFAAKALMTIDPTMAYPGSSHLLESLDYFVRSAAQRRALIVHPRSVDAQTLVGMLHEIGYEADAASTGRQAFDLAVRQPDYEFLLISDAIDLPVARELIHELRQDPRTATLPIGLMAREHTLDRTQRLAAGDDLTESFPRPHDVQGLSFQLGRMLSLADRHLVEEGERILQARLALEWLEQILTDRHRYRFYSVLEMEEPAIAALFVRELTQPAAKVLALLATADAQTALLEMASQTARPLTQRRAAADAFARAVEQRGVMLTTAQIHRQYDRYNQSARLDAETQEILGSLLDAIEAPTAGDTLAGDESAEQ